MPKFEESEAAGRVILRALKGEITPEQAAESVKQIMKKQCVVGPQGVCQTHGQVISDCEE